MGLCYILRAPCVKPFFIIMMQQIVRISYDSLNLDKVRYMNCHCEGGRFSA